MSNRLAVVVAVSAVSLAGAVASCSFGSNGDFTCDPDSPTAACGPRGICQQDGFCSIPDRTCDSGQRYGDQSGPHSGDCVGDNGPVGTGSDAGTGGGRGDASTPPPDAPTFCYGTTNIVKVCFAAEPTKSISIAETTTLNTDSGQSENPDVTCMTPLSGGDGYCVVAATDINIQATLRAVGSKPLVLIATGTISAGGTGRIDVSSKRGATTEVGAGADPATVCTIPAGNNPAVAGGGAGGSFTGKGGAGGKGIKNGSVGGTALDAVALPINKLRGGCPGQAGEGTTGSGGHGGGAVFLIANTKIGFDGPILAGGEGAKGGANQQAGGGGSGGGGAGAGGMIGLDAPIIDMNNALIANGGGGGEGGSTAAVGNDGDDAVGKAAASGGSAASNSGGDGGAGSTGAANGPGKDGKLGADVANGLGGGGGGGGGAGYILATHDADLGNNVSPAAVITP